MRAGTPTYYMCDEATALAKNLVCGRNLNIPRRETLRLEICGGDHGKVRGLTSSHPVFLVSEPPELTVV
jgi:hypothetical protein